MARPKLRGKAPSDEQRATFDTQKHGMIFAVFAVLFAYAYFFTGLASYIGLPSPEKLAQACGLKLEHTFSSDENVSAKIHMSRTSIFSGNIERLILFGVIFATFVSTYYLPIKHKKHAIVSGFLVGFGLVYGLEVSMTFLAAHLLVYCVFHHENELSQSCASWFGFFFGYIICDSSILKVYSGFAAALAAYLFFKFLLKPSLEKVKFSYFARIAVVHSWIPLIIYGAQRNNLSDNTFELMVGLILFFFQWARLMVYHKDFEDKGVPCKLSVIEYASVFMSPATIFNFAWAPYLGQGYTYLNQRYLCEDKNKTILDGLKLWMIALMYLLCASEVTIYIADFMTQTTGTKVYRYTGRLMRAYLRGEQVSTGSVLSTTFLDQSRIFLVYGGLTHFRVGIWRVFGYQMDPQYNKPWLATNLVSLWGRFAFHFREFLVKTFYYPMFFRFFKKKQLLRVFMATMVATAVGNHLWGHVPVAVLREMEWSKIGKILSVWPYFLMLGLGISLTQLYILKKRSRSRKPWTRDRYFALDIICAYLTLQYFSLIHVFIRPEPELGGNLTEYCKIFLLGLGIDLR